jgi:hypothetical protein
MRLAALLALLLLVACGHQEPPQVPPPTPRPTAECETNLDAGTPCDPCPGAAREDQFDAIAQGQTFTQRRCFCDADGGRFLAWNSCPATVDTPTCAVALATWSSVCIR